jgi:hypothetical protein
LVATTLAVSLYLYPSWKTIRLEAVMVAWLENSPVMILVMPFDLLIIRFDLLEVIIDSDVGLVGEELAEGESASFLPVGDCWEWLSVAHAHWKPVWVCWSLEADIDVMTMVELEHSDECYDHYQHWESEVQSEQEPVWAGSGYSHCADIVEEVRNVANGVFEPVMAVVSSVGLSRLHVVDVDMCNYDLLLALDVAAAQAFGEVALALRDMEDLTKAQAG